MLTKDELKGQWSEVTNRLRSHWNQLSEADLSAASQSADELVGMVQNKTGAAREEIENVIEGIVAEGRTTANQVGRAAAQYADDASQIAKEQYAQAADLTADFSKKLAHTVRSRPTESLAIAFGVGIVVGALTLMGRRHR